MVVGSTSEKATIPVFRRVFLTHGVLEVVKSDNGPPFNSRKFDEYALEEGFKHQKVTPRWLEAKCDVERCMHGKNHHITGQTALRGGAQGDQSIQSNGTPNHWS